MEPLYTCHQEATNACPNKNIAHLNASYPTTSSKHKSNNLLSYVALGFLLVLQLMINNQGF